MAAKMVVSDKSEIDHGTKGQRLLLAGPFDKRGSQGFHRLLYEIVRQPPMVVVLIIKRITE